MNEIPFFFSNDNYKLFGVFHDPGEKANNQGFIFLHPFAEEKLWAHRVLVNFARELAKRGYSILRFDYMGHGDSGGDFENSSVETRLSDIEKALHTLKSKAPHVRKIGLVGLRFGATLAVMAGERLPEINKLILWEPILEGDKYMQQILRSNLATQNAVYKEIRYTREQLVEELKQGNTIKFDGYQLAYPFFDQASSINLLLNDISFTGKVLIVQIERVKKKLSPKIVAFKEKYPVAELELVKEEPFWKETKFFCSQAGNLYQTTLTWLEKYEE